MMHGFDWKGARFNEQGQKQPIWDKKTGKGKAVQENSQCVPRFFECSF
jgi:hypothetical protein